MGPGVEGDLAPLIGGGIAASHGCPGMGRFMQGDGDEEDEVEPEGEEGVVQRRFSISCGDPAARVSRSARSKIQAAGGEITELPRTTWTRDGVVPVKAKAPSRTAASRSAAASDDSTESEAS